VPFESMTPLPAFTAIDAAKGGPTSYVLGATLTRDARLGKEEGKEGEEEALVVDVFFMGVSSMVGGATFSGVGQDEGASNEWRAAARTMNQNVRAMAVDDGYAYACRFQLAHAWGEGEGEGLLADVVVPAVVVPVRCLFCFGVGRLGVGVMLGLRF
jgi:hypothetical protein